MPKNLYNKVFIFTFLQRIKRISSLEILLLYGFEQKPDFMRVDLESSSTLCKTPSIKEVICTKSGTGKFF